MADSVHHHATGGAHVATGCGILRDGAGRRVSVALATYNGAPYLAQQLDSLARQTLLPAELVACDDQSTDDTVALLRAFSATAPFPVRVEVNARRLGYADNFLKAAGLCQSDHVALCDQDDVWLPAKLATGMDRLTTDGSVLALHRSTMTDAELRSYDTLDQGIAADAVFEPFAIDPYITGWGNTMLFARALLGRVPADRRPRQPENPDRILSHDTWIYTLAAALGRVSHIAEPLLLYRQHGRNAQGARRRTPAQRLDAALSVPAARLAARRDFDLAMADLLDRAVDDAALACAAGIYRLRGEAQAARLVGYTHRSTLARARAFRRYYTLAAQDPAYRATTASRMKDVILGMARLGRLR